MLNLEMGRRDFLKTIAAGGVSSLVPGALWAGTPKEAVQPFPVCVFVKFLQSLSFTDLAQRISELGCQGIEATVRNGGQISPDQAADRLPEFVDALQQQGLEVTIMASSINRVDDPHAEETLRAAAKLGIKRYRLSYYRYDLSKPVKQQLDDYRPIVRDLAAMNRDLGIQGVYQNHAGAKMVGASIWDLCDLLDGIPPEEIGIAYDVRHAGIEGGTCWPATWNLVQPKLASVYVKNARWNGRKVENIPLGEQGVVDPGLFRTLPETGFRGPLSLHVEYLKPGDVEKHVAAIREDLETLNSWLQGGNS